MPESVTSVVVGAALFVIVAGSMIGWGLVVARAVQGKPVCSYQPRRPVPWSLLDLGLIVFAAFSAMVIAYALFTSFLGVRIATPPGDMDAQLLSTLMLCDSTTSVAALVVACAYLAWRVGARLRDLGVDWQCIRADIGLGLVAFFMLVVPVYTIQALLTWLLPDQAKHPLITMLEANTDPQLLIAAAIVAVVVAPLVEEMFFRVMLQGWLEKVVDSRGNLQQLIFGAAPGPMMDPAVEPRFLPADESRAEWADVESNTDAVADQSADQSVRDEVELGMAAHKPANPYASPQLEDVVPPASNSSATTPIRPHRWPIFVSAAIFSAMHLGHGYDFVPLFVLALGLGYLYQQTHRVVPCIVVHLLLNASSLIMLWLSVTYGEGL